MSVIKTKFTLDEDAIKDAIRLYIKHEKEVDVSVVILNATEKRSMDDRVGLGHRIIAEASE